MEYPHRPERHHLLEYHSPVEKTDVVVVGGAGHVGLPFANTVAATGLKVISYDIDSAAVDQINEGRVPFYEVGLQELLAANLKSKNFIATTSVDVITSARIVVIVIGTPVDEFLSAKPHAVVNEIRKIVPYLKNGQHLMLRSTIYPGLTKKISDLLAENGLVVTLSYCPERIAEGKALEELVSLPQIVGSIDGLIAPEVEEIFQKLGVEIIKLSIEEAELAKLFSNAWRYMTFAAANSLFMIAESEGANFEKIRAALKYKYPRASDIPSAGFAAGPCLPKDTMQLQTLAGGNFLLGAASYSVNENLPNFVISRMEKEYNLSKLSVAVLGMSFKANIDDIRSSLSFKLAKLLEFRAKSVICVDPFVKGFEESKLASTIEMVDLIVIGSPHDVFREINTVKPIIDIWDMDGSGILIKKSGFIK